MAKKTLEEMLEENRRVSAAVGKKVSGGDKGITQRKLSSLVYDEKATVRKTGQTVQGERPAAGTKPGTGKSGSSGKTAVQLVDGKRVKVWLMLAGITVAMPISMYLFYRIYLVVVTAFANAFPRLFAVISWFEDAAETTVCGLLVTLIFIFFSEELFDRVEKFCPTRGGLRYLGLGCLSAAVALAGLVLLIRELQLGGQSGEAELWSRLYVLYAIALYAFGLFSAFNRFGNPRLLFWKLKVTVFMADDGKQQQYYASVWEGPGLIKLDGSIDMENLWGMVTCVRAMRPEYAMLPGQSVLCCTAEKEGLLCCDQIQVTVDQTGQALMWSRRNLRYLPNGKRGVMLPNSALGAQSITYSWKKN